jgi:hypothetical protein
MNEERYAVIIAIPLGINTGEVFDNLGDASDHFGQASRGSYPDGTEINLFDGDTLLDKATVDTSTKTAARAEANEILAAIIDQANRNAAARLA